MIKLIISTALFLLVAATSTVQAKDKHKSKHKHHDDHDRYSDYQSSRYYAVNNSHRYSESHRDRSRTIYLIERDRPVQRVVYIDSDGRYYQQYDGRRSYVSQHYYKSYPSRYYTSSGQRRINISLPF